MCLLCEIKNLLQEGNIPHSQELTSEQLRQFEAKQIKIGEHGEILSYADPLNEVNSETDLVGKIGLHIGCMPVVDNESTYRPQSGTLIEINIISETHKVLYCPGCGLRAIIPFTVKTYGDLRKWREENLK